MVKVKEDLTGKQFGGLTVLKQVEDHITKSGEHCAQWLCECGCSEHNKIVVIGKNLKSTKHCTRSCGCLAKETASIVHKKYNDYKLNLKDEYGLYGIGYCSNSKKEFYFDMDDYELIKNGCWIEHIDHHGYSRLEARINNQIIKMSHLLGYKEYDHIDRNPLNNRRNNFRTATHSENNINQSIQSNNTSGIIGVSWNTWKQKWTAYINIDKKYTYLGDFISKDDAIITRLKAEAKYYGEFAPQKHLFEQYGIIEKELNDDERREDRSISAIS